MSDDPGILPVSSLDDRRKIVSLEAKTADLEHKLAIAMGRANPALTIERGTCYHFGTPKVSDRDPSVTCGDCGTELDPYDVLRSIAHKEFDFCYQLNDLRKEAEQLRDEVKRLKAQRSRLRKTLASGKDAVGA